MTLSLKIYELLKSKVLLYYEWGFHAPFKKPDGFGFKVRGAAFRGIVTIRQHGHLTVVVEAEELTNILPLQSSAI